MRTVNLGVDRSNDLVARETAYVLQRSSNGGETALSKFAVVAYSFTGDPEMGDYDDGQRSSSGKASFRQPSTEVLVAVVDIKAQGLKMSERLETLNKARARMIEDRDLHAKVLAAPFDRDKAERARNKFIEIQALVDALDRAISGEEVFSPKS